MILNTKDLAEHLDVPIDTLERWIRQGRIPVNKITGKCEFNENSLKKWAKAHHLSYRAVKQKPGPPDEDQPESLVTVMKRGGVLYDLEGDAPPLAIQSGVNQLSYFSEETREMLFERLMEREKMMSTGIGKGVAIPHPRTPLEHLEKSIIATCFLKNPVDFKAIDGKPVFCLFIILSLSIKIHLHLLSSLTFFLRHDSFVSFLKKAPAGDAFFQEIAKMEKKINTLKEGRA